MTSRFTLLRQLGRGGMGVVWQARDEESGSIVALKLLHGQFVDDPEYLERFAREVELARRVDSPHVVRVQGYGVREGTPYLVMEYVAGESLRERLGRGPLPPAEARRILVQLAEGLAACHAAGIVHRDLKPSNVLLAPNGTAKLGDFGIARAADLTSLTGTGALLGTPAYLAPEGARDERSDLYALGCIAYELLAGAPPFAGSTPQEVFLAHLRETPDLGRVPPADRPLLGRLLAKDPVDRPGSAAEVLGLLRETGNVPVPTRRPRSGARSSGAVLVAPGVVGTRRPSRRRVIVAALLLIAAAVALVWGLQPDHPGTLGSFALIAGWNGPPRRPRGTARALGWIPWSREILVRGSLGGFLLFGAAVGFPGAASRMPTLLLNQVMVASLSIPTCAAGSTDCLGGNIEIAETAGGQLQSGDVIRLSVLATSGGQRDVLLRTVGNATPVVSANTPSSGVSAGSVQVTCGASGDCYIEFTLDRPSPTTATAQIIISNFQYVVLTGAQAGPVQIEATHMSGAGQAFDSVVSNAQIAAPTPSPSPSPRPSPSPSPSPRPSPSPSPSPRPSPVAVGSPSSSTSSASPIGSLSGPGASTPPPPSGQGSAPASVVAASPSASPPVAQIPATVAGSPTRLLLGLAAAALLIALAIGVLVAPGPRNNQRR